VQACLQKVDLDCMDLDSMEDMLCQSLGAAVLHALCLAAARCKISAMRTLGNVQMTFAFSTIDTHYYVLLLAAEALRNLTRACDEHLVTHGAAARTHNHFNLTPRHTPLSSNSAYVVRHPQDQLRVV
jgi:hypothetical protein